MPKWSDSVSHRDAIYGPEIYNYQITINTRQFNPSTESIKKNFEWILVTIYIEDRVFIFIRIM